MTREIGAAPTPYVRVRVEPVLKFGTRALYYSLEPRYPGGSRQKLLNCGFWQLWTRPPTYWGTWICCGARSGLTGLWRRTLGSGVDSATSYLQIPPCKRRVTTARLTWGRQNHAPHRWPCQDVSQITPCLRCIGLYIAYYLCHTHAIKQYLGLSHAQRHHQYVLPYRRIYIRQKHPR